MKDTEYELNRLYEWLVSDPRKPAITAFTSGDTRKVASEIEFREHQYKKEIERLKKLNHE